MWTRRCWVRSGRATAGTSLGASDLRDALQPGSLALCPGGRSGRFLSEDITEWHKEDVMVRWRRRAPRSLDTFKTLRTCFSARAERLRTARHFFFFFLDLLIAAGARLMCPGRWRSAQSAPGESFLSSFSAGWAEYSWSSIWTSAGWGWEHRG